MAWNYYYYFFSLLLLVVARSWTLVIKVILCTLSSRPQARLKGGSNSFCPSGHQFKTYRGGIFFFSFNLGSPRPARVHEQQQLSGEKKKQQKKKKTSLTWQIKQWPCFQPPSTDGLRNPPEVSGFDKRRFDPIPSNFSLISSKELAAPPNRRHWAF